MDPIPRSGRPRGEGNGNPFLGNPMDRGAWQAIVQRVGHNLASEHYSYNPWHTVDIRRNS